MHLRIAMPTLGDSPWWQDAAASTDRLADTERVVVCPRELAVGSDNWRWLRDAGEGLYAAVNAGLRAPGAWDVGTYLNDDDRLVAAGVDQALARLKSDASLGAVFGRVHLINSTGERVTEIPMAHRGDDLGPLFATGIIPLAQPGTLFRREMFESLGGFDTDWKAAGDMEFFMRALRAGWRFEFVDSCVAEFRVHPAQISRKTVVVEAERTRLIERARQEDAWSATARAATRRFRLQNIAIYVARVRRHGFASMDRLYREGAGA